MVMTAEAKRSLVLRGTRSIRLRFVEGALGRGLLRARALKKASAVVLSVEVGLFA